ncbi:hypothetical protein Q8G50_32680, partial [Klebsiella pneumoniae]
LLGAFSVVDAIEIKKSTNFFSSLFLLTMQSIFRGLFFFYCIIRDPAITFIKKLILSVFLAMKQSL